MDPRPELAAVVLVEGVSDQVALETLAARYGRDLAAEGIRVVPMGGATSIGRFLDLFGPAGAGVRLAGLCDEAEERHFQRGLERIGFGRGLTRAHMQDKGFHVCISDLEDELIRALGIAAVVSVIEAAGDLTAWRTFQNQPAQRGRPVPQQLNRFMGTQSGRKVEYARLLVDALELRRAPEPLQGVLAQA